MAPVSLPLPRRRLAGVLALVLACASSLALPSRAAQLEGLEAPERIQLGDRELVLNGIGLRTVERFLLSAKIYAAALYLEAPSRDATRVLDSTAFKQINLRYLYAIDAADMQRAWAYSFEQNCPSQSCDAYEASLAQFQGLVRAVAEGDLYEYRFAGPEVTVVRNGAELGRIVDPGFSRLLLSTWIGASPPTEELKRSLLTGGVAEP